MADRLRTFDETVADLDPTEIECIERMETFERDKVEVHLYDDVNEPGAWRVEHFDREDGTGYVTFFAGPQAEQRARDYFEALKSGKIKIVVDDGRLVKSAR